MNSDRESPRVTFNTRIQQNPEPPVRDGSEDSFYNM
jgi:hypothetical protein